MQIKKQSTRCLLVEFSRKGNIFHAIFCTQFQLHANAKHCWLHLFCRQNVPEEDFQLGEVDATMAGTTLENTCDQFPFCPPEASRYRNIDGKCNNPDPKKGAWGAAGSPMYVLLMVK